jgi:hypothetical protein
MQKIAILLITLMVVGVGVFSGCTQQQSRNNPPNDDSSKTVDPVIQRAEPYISKIDMNNITLRTYANSIIRECLPNDKEAQINAIYRYVVENYNYVSDPRNTEFIQSPQETMQIKGGDCEDLSIFLNSLLENIGIKTYLVLTKDHAYSLASDVDTDKLWTYVEQSLIRQVEKDWGENIRQSFNQTFILEGYNNWYYGGNDSSFGTSIDYMNINYDVVSDKPLHFYIVPSMEDFNLCNEGKTFTHYPDYERENVLNFKGSASNFDKYGGIILCNNNWEDATITVNLMFYFHPSFYELFKNQTITSYKIDNTNCVVLDATAGVYGYPGYDAELTGEKIAIDPLTREYVYLD